MDYLDRMVDPSEYWDDYIPAGHNYYTDEYPCTREDLDR